MDGSPGLKAASVNQASNRRKVLFALMPKNYVVARQAMLPGLISLICDPRQLL